MTFRLEKPLNAHANRMLRGASKIPWGIDFLDDALLGIANTDLTLLGAATGAGKTQIASHLAFNASKAARSVVFFALEAEDGEIEDRILWAELSREWWARNPKGKPGIDLRYVAWRNGLLDDELLPLEQEIHTRVAIEMSSLRTIYANEQGAFSVDEFVRTFDSLQEEADLVVVDHMHYFDLEDENENRGLKIAAKKIRQASLRNKKPVLLLAHLRKANRIAGGVLPDIDDFYGSSDLVKIGVNVILAARADDKTIRNGNRATWFYIAKARHAGDTQGYAAIVGYDLQQGRYSPGYQIYRARRYQEPELLGLDEIPRWAKRAKAAGPSKTMPPEPQERLF